MHVLEVGDSVIQVRFLPDGGRLLAAVGSEQGTVRFELWSPLDGQRFRLSLPPLDIRSWWDSWYGHAVVIHPDGEWGYIAWGGRLFTFRTLDGVLLPVPEGVEADQVVISPDGTRLLAARILYRHHDRKELRALTTDVSGGAVLWRKTMSAAFWHVAGFLPDGQRYVTMEPEVHIRSLVDDDEQVAPRYPANQAYQPQLSPDGRHLGVIGYASMYVYDLATLGKPRRITSTRSCGDFAAFAFHPDGQTLAVIHGGPTLLKIYDLATLKLIRTYRWKIGPLQCVAFSSDGMLGAAGSRDGRVVLWDVDP